jgi:hypothetical protein
MTGAEILPIARAVTMPNSLGSVARVEKSHDSNRLHNDQAECRFDRRGGSSRVRKSPPTRNGTEAAPRWYGRRLSAGFIAQILGQVLAGGAPDRASAQAVYADTRRTRQGTVLDCSV